MADSAVIRALRRQEGRDSYAPLFAAPANGSYILENWLTNRSSIIQVVTLLTSGTLTLAVQVKLPGGSFVSVAGMGAIAVTSTSLITLPTGDGTEYATQGSQIQIVVSAGATPIGFNLALVLQRR